MLPRSAWVAFLLVLTALSGCSSSDLRQIGASHCHAEHDAKLVGTPWDSQATGSPHDNGTRRIYTWMLHRDDACVSELELTAYLVLDIHASPCGGVDLDSANATGNLQLGPKTFYFDQPPTEEANGWRSWAFGAGYRYPEGTPEGNPQSWVATIVLTVPHEDLVFAESIDKCVTSAVKAVTLEGRDRDYRA